MPLKDKDKVVFQLTHTTHTNTHTHSEYCKITITTITRLFPRED